MGILIAIEGTDSSGKETQSGLVYNKLKDCGVSVKKVSFPAYDSESSSLVKMYLAGEFGTNPDDVNAYAASTFYAADRFATFRKEWGSDYNSDTVIIADRYVSSNMIHQASKCKTDEEKEQFINWLTELEYKHFGLPVPDAVIFLDMPPEIAQRLMRERLNKIDNSEKKDIHERNSEYLKKSYDNAVQIAKLRNWVRVPCARDGEVRSIDDINNEIMETVNRIISE